MLVPRTAGVWLFPVALASALAFALALLVTPAEAQTRKAVRPAAKPYAKQYTKRTLPRRAAAPAPAPVAANPNVVGRDAMLLVDAESGRELEAHAADDLRHPASLTKIMTLYLTFGALDAGQLKLSDRLPVSVRAASMQPSKLGVPAGGTLMVRDAVMGLITRSANDAAVVLAEGIAGDEDSFAQLMTQKARQLGMTSTVFRNASGLPSTYQVTTARDLTRLAQAMLRDFPHYYPLFSTRSWPFGRTILTNHNRMLGNYAGADGIKTGYINASGFNLVMSAMRDNRRLIGVVLGGNSVGERDEVMADMMDRGFEKCRTMRLAAWQQPQQPTTARYTAINFTPGAAPAEPQQQVARSYNPPNGSRSIADVVSEQAAPTTAAVSPLAMTRGPTPPQGSQAAETPAGWAIQLGSTFATRPAANAALRTALSRLPGLRSDARPAVDALKSARGQITYRARLTNLDESGAARGCRTLKNAKLFACTPVAVE
ncbi:D-alanyl-D-alanine carboxypeptidase [Vineibacter terrae]|uniref:D-alanyl-D-alanine carboxypeptidase n=1 Tax=Vineibacter terrae TaxID=2586908 RepID=A0A5C8PKX5_9HYPH|nr:serine hydrolase [Vineibacter terrae]TXL74333.1 D-alanyl-D-alanine carboxypeptidase [Vineibacter terrae]